MAATALFETGAGNGSNFPAGAGYETVVVGDAWAERCAGEAGAVCAGNGSRADDDGWVELDAAFCAVAS